MENDLKALLTIERKFLANDIQKVLEKSEICSTLKSDDSVSPELNTYPGLNIVENITVLVNDNDYSKAMEVISKSRYRIFLNSVKQNDI